ncbi:hypothetical protein KIH74_22885 [Kineosporia sp. J2-2]|uniref:Phage tail protein n=1 Tax=Kineosporia corallincola TaxID=2835133 RepID=A0ABS5TLB9_9ACTN|nr:hypothetical protein [Kineosporia corallincola]MBT0771805.1 hypothetical protein [Kineosporia corallincola]
MTASPIVTDVPGEGWWIDGVYLGDIGTMITADGWDDVAAERGDDQELLGLDGVRFRPHLTAAGTRTIQMGVHGARWDGFQWVLPASGTAQRALFEANLDRLLRLVGVRHRPLLVRRVYPDGSVRRAQCRVTGQIAPTRQGNSYGEVQFTLLVLGGFFEDVDELTSRLPYDTDGPSTQTVEVFSLRGQSGSCADAEISVTGACSSLSVVDAETGLGFSYASALTSGQTLVVQPGGRFAATLAGASIITSIRFGGSRLLRISPAPDESRGPSLKITAPGKTSAFSVTVRSRRKWLR